MNQSKQSYFRRLIKSILPDALVIYTLWVFSVAQPLFNLVSQYPEFLVSHNSTPADVWLFVLALCIGFPSVLVLLEVSVFLINVRLRALLHLTIVYILAMLLALQFLHKSPITSTSAILLIGALAAVGFLSLYVRWQPIRLMIVFCSFSIIVFPVNFLAFSSARTIAFPEGNEVDFDLNISNRPPVILLVLDELGSAYLQDEDGNIDAKRYPNFAGLADDGYWFPNAMTVSSSTVRAVPAILSGNYYKMKNGEDPLPILADHPRNLFTMLDEVYELNVFESLTRLSPHHYLDTERSSAEIIKHYKSLFGDAYVVYLHTIYPPKLAEKLPSVSMNWEGFTPVPETGNAKIFIVNGKPQLGLMAGEEGRGEMIQDFIDSIEASNDPQLSFLHVLLPHLPFDYMPSGKRYLGPRVYPPSNTWPDDVDYVKREFQRYILQVGYADKVIGEIVARLKQEGIYDDAMILVTSDHGVAYRPGALRRGARSADFADILSVPLFIKIPRQKGGVQDMRYVETVDILPTIADVLGVQLSWEMDGFSLFSPNYPDKTKFRLVGIRGGGVDDGVITYELTELKEKQKDISQHYLGTFGSGTSRPHGLFEIGEHKELIGARPGEDIPLQNAPLTTKVDQQVLLTNIDTQQLVLPLYISGSVASNNSTFMVPRELAISVNDEIWTTFNAANDGRFSAMIPEKALKNGENQLEVFAVSTSNQNGKVVLLKGETLQVAEKFKFSDGAIIDKETNEHFYIQPSGGIRVRVKGIESINHTTEITGWAIDTKISQPVSMVAVFSGGENIWSGVPTQPSSDVAKYFNEKGLKHSGFWFVVSSDSLSSDLRVFGLSGGTAKEAMVYPEPYLDQRIFSPFDESYRIVEDSLINSETREIFSISPKSHWLSTVRVQLREGKMVISGATIDRDNKRLVDRVVLFNGTQSRSASPTTVLKANVAEFFKNPLLERSGYMFVLPENTDVENLRIFAISGLVATEASFTAPE